MGVYEEAVLGKTLPIYDENSPIYEGDKCFYVELGEIIGAGLVAILMDMNDKGHSFNDIADYLESLDN